MRTPAAKRQPVDYVAKANALDWTGLVKLWNEIETKRTPGWAAGRAMEHLVLQGFKLSSAEVIWPYSVPMNGQIIEQIDGMIICEGLKCMIESKDLDTNLNVEPLAKLRNQMLRRPSGIVGCVFSATGFTDPAKTLAQFMAPHAILLWQGPEIRYLIEQRDFSAALREKYRQLMQHGNPDFDTRALRR